MCILFSHMDRFLTAMVALLAKTNLNHDVGYLESGLTNSPEMMVLANEIISMTGGHGEVPDG